jgi:Subtilisin inhibitor-like
MAVLAALAALVLTGTGAGAGGATELRITVWPRGTSRPSLHRTLRCDPGSGTLPRPARACRRLAAQATPFAPIPPNTACTQIYGGPQVALVAGTYRGMRIWARFQRRNGCEIARWARVGFLFSFITH